MNVQSAIDAGLFVQFVYDRWNSTSQTTDLDGAPILTSAGAPVVPGKNYTVLKTIYACDLATCIDPTRPGDEGWKTMGIVAVNNVDAQDAVIAIRGTSTIWEWIQDINFLMKPFPNVSGAGLTEDGFTDMYQSFSLTPADSNGNFLKNCTALLPATAKVTVAGHSLGAAIATLFALDLAVNSPLAITLYTLASPRVGDLTFCHLFNHTVPNAYRIANRLDIVPQTPPPLLYFHVGDETELIPGPQMKFDLACEHILTSYLNMLATLVGQQTDYPLEANCLKAGPAS